MLLITGLLNYAPQGVSAGEILPEPSEVTQRMVERSQTVAQAGQGPQYTYQKRSLLQRLDAVGTPLKSEEKILPGHVDRWLSFQAAGQNPRSRVKQ